MKQLTKQNPFININGTKLGDIYEDCSIKPSKFFKVIFINKNTVTVEEFEPEEVRPEFEI